MTDSYTYEKDRVEDLIADKKIKELMQQFDKSLTVLSMIQNKLCREDYQQIFGLERGNIFYNRHNVDILELWQSPRLSKEERDKILKYFAEGKFAGDD